MGKKQCFPVGVSAQAARQREGRGRYFSVRSE
jgi:hypothetical protein